ncbi:MAG: DUF721 domain-containing protein [Proteobacteria bacterium]|nr:DUF721 domain-containing protein [Pseudomonadota bacterium]
MPGGDRHVYGPRALAALLPAVTRPAFRRRSPAGAQIMADWPAIVGPALAAVSAPRGLASGTLTIACSGPIALELAHLADELRGRINGHLGREAVAALRFVQTMPAAPPAAAPAPAPPPDPAARARAERALADLPPGPLRDALAGLGALVLAGAPSEIAPRPMLRGQARTTPSTRTRDLG